MIQVLLTGPLLFLIFIGLKFRVLLLVSIKLYAVDGNKSLDFGLYSLSCIFMNT